VAGDGVAGDGVAADAAWEEFGVSLSDGQNRRAMRSLTRPPLLALAASDRLERLVRAVPPAEGLAWRRLASRYVAGRTADDAFATVRRLAEDGVLSSIDFFGENVIDPAEADRVADAYVGLGRRLLDGPAGTFLSLDLSHFGLDEPGAGVQRRLARVASALPDGSRVQVGAEQAARADRILDAVLTVARSAGPVGATVQANLYRSPADVAALAEAGVPVRLVKGAYAEDPSIARAWGEATDVAFVELAHELRQSGADFTLATHDPVVREALLAAMPGVGVEMLLGVRGDDLRALVRRGIPARVYVPFGDRWFRYAMRRLAESRGSH
jgi:proline dehydrogenase